MLQSMGSQRVGQDLATKHQQVSFVTALFTESNVFEVHLCFCMLILPFFLLSKSISFIIWIYHIIHSSGDGIGLFPPLDFYQ